MLQSCLTFLPEHAKFINEHCAKVCENGRVAIHNASGVMLSYLQSDDYGRRMAIGLRRANCRISILTMSRVLKLEFLFGSRIEYALEYLIFNQLVHDWNL